MGFYPGSFPVVVDMEQGIELGGVAVTATAAELNLVDGVSAPGVDGLGLFRVARATYDFAEHGGAIGAINLGVTIPDNAIVCGGFIDVVTTCTTAAAEDWAGVRTLAAQLRRKLGGRSHTDSVDLLREDRAR